VLSRGRSWLFVATAVTAAAIALPAAAPASQRAYFSDRTISSLIPGFDVAADGSLSPLPGFPVAAGSSGLEGLTISADGSKLFAADVNGTTFGYSIDAAGVLHPGTPGATATDAHGIVATPDGRHVYVALTTPGEIAGFNVGTDGSLTPTDQVTIDETNKPTGLAMAPDGQHMYGVGENSSVYTYAIGADGALDRGPGLPVGGQPFAVSISPDGRNLYVPTRNLPNPDLLTYPIAADGSLSLPQGTVPVGGGMNPFGMTVTPDGKYLYTANFSSGTISGFTLTQGSLPVPLPGSPFSVSPGSNPTSVTSNAAGTRLYVVDGNSAYGFAIGAGGIPAPLPGSPFATGVVGDFESVALTPAQPPTASFTTAVNNKRVTFDGSPSSDSDGTVARYDWDFGDGKTLANGGPRPTHKYRGPKGTTTLTVTDDEGCSVTFLTAGQTPYCNGSGVARVALIPFQAKVLSGGTQKLGSAVKLKLSCPVDCTVKVVGRVKLSGGTTKAKKAKLKSATKKLKAGRSKTLKLKLSGKGRRDAAAAKKAAARLKITARDDAGDQFKVKQTIGLK
jgi:DNA-binding beta-propeller fold protein YncE